MLSLFDKVEKKGKYTTAMQNLPIMVIIQTITYEKMEIHSMLIKNEAKNQFFHLSRRQLGIV